MPRSFPRTQATTSENVDRSQRRIQHGNLAGLEHISMIKIHVAEWSSSKFDLRFFSVSDSEIPIHPTTGQQKLSNNPEKCNAFGKCYQVLPLLTSRSIFRGIWTGKIQNLLMRWSCSCLCSMTLDGHRKALQKHDCTVPKKWQHLRPNSSQDAGASWGPRQTNHLGGKDCGNSDCRFFRNTKKRK